MNTLNPIIENKITPSIEKQLETFRKGIPFVKISRPAAIGAGIKKYSEKEQQDYAKFYDQNKEDFEVVRFVPASGAATRMFKFLHRFLQKYHPDKNIDDFLSKEKNALLNKFFEFREKFAFHNLIMERLTSKNPNFQNLPKGNRYYAYVQEMLTDEGLNFSNTPKGLIPFHGNDENFRTAFEEQLHESIFYANKDGIVKIHFTVSPNHKEKFADRFEQIRRRIEAETNHKFEISYSFQKEETNTIAVSMDNEPFVCEDGKFLFRPAGHGALLENLNEIDADIIFIKNIDNVIHQKDVEQIGFYKKVLGGKLIEIQNKTFEFLRRLDSENFDEKLKKEIQQFLKEEFELDQVPETKADLTAILDRPTRVCGVVENTGAPGGGPFLVEHKDGKFSYQIVEMSQIDLSDEQQEKMISKATHFNPVDLVCGVKNHKGEKYNLSEFSDPETGFITEKSYQGKTIKALELPGLWNGSMALWNTVFVEVPLITFNPVKTVNDLLNDAHQG